MSRMREKGDLFEVKFMLATWCIVILAWRRKAPDKFIGLLFDEGERSFVIHVSLLRSNDRGGCHVWEKEGSEENIR